MDVPGQRTQTADVVGGWLGGRGVVVVVQARVGSQAFPLPQNFELTGMEGLAMQARTAVQR